MPRVVAIGERRAVQGYALAGVHVAVAESASTIREAWAGAQDAAVILLTPAAYASLGRAVAERETAPGTPLLLVLP